MLFIKALDFMQLCEAFSVNPTRESSPKSNGRRLQEQTSPLSEGDSLSNAFLTTGSQQKTVQTDGGPGTVAHSRPECAAPTPSLLVLNKCEISVRRDNFNGIQRAPKCKCLVV